MASKKVKQIDFSGVDKEIRKGGGGGKRIPEGDYVAKIIDGEFVDNDGKKGIQWQFQIIKGKHKGVKLRGYTSLKPEALWSLRNLIHAATAKNVAGKALKLDLDKLIGKVVGIAVEDNEYTKDGKTKITSQVNTCFPKDEVGEVEEEDDETDDEEDEEDEEDDDEEEEDEDLEDVDVEEL